MSGEITETKVRIPIYENLFGKQYVGPLFESFMVGPYERIELMKKFKNSLRGNELAQELYDVFEDAAGMQGPPKQLINTLEKKINLGKLIKEKRINRVMENFERVGNRLRVPMDDVGANYVPIFVTTMMISYGKLETGTKLNLEAFETNDHNIRGMLVMALLSEYCKTVNPYDCINLGFVLFFIKTLSVYSMIQKEVFEAHPELRDYVDNILTVIERVTDYLPEEYIAKLEVQDTGTEYVDAGEV